MRHPGRFSITAGLLLIAAALCIVGYNLWDAGRAGDSSAKAAQQLITLLPPTPVPVAEQAAQVPPEEIVYPDYQLNPGMEMPVLTADSLDCIGVLSIPALSLELPVQSQWSYPNLKKAPCRYSGTAYESGFVLSAHNYRRHFGLISTLSPGDSISFTDTDGNIFSYEVAEICTLMPTDVEEMLDDSWDLTLFTCTVGGRSRVTVRCLRAE